MSISHTTTANLVANPSTAERELDLGIHAMIDTVVRLPFGAVRMNLGATRMISGVDKMAEAAVRLPFGSLRMNAAATRNVVVVAG